MKKLLLLGAILGLTACAPHYHRHQAPPPVRVVHYWSYWDYYPYYWHYSPTRVVVVQPRQEVQRNRYEFKQPTTTVNRNNVRQRTVQPQQRPVNPTPRRVAPQRKSNDRQTNRNKR